MDICNAHGIVDCPACRAGHAIVPLLGQPAPQQQPVAAPPQAQTLLSAGFTLVPGHPYDLPDGTALPTLKYTFLHPDGSGTPIGAYLLVFDPSDAAKITSMLDQALAAAIDQANPAPANPEGTPPV